MVDVKMSNFANRCSIASSHAGRAQHAHLRRVRLGLERSEQRLRSLELAGDGIADANGRGWRRSLPFLHDVEMGIERGDLVDRGLRQTHFVAKRAQMRCREIVVAILDQVQKLDQEIGAAGRATLAVLRTSRSASTSSWRPLGKARARFREPTLRAGRSGPPLFAIFCATPPTPRDSTYGKWARKRPVRRSSDTALALQRQAGPRSAFFLWAVGPNV